VSTHTQPGPRSVSGRTGALVIAAAAGDESAWRALVQRYDALVQREVRRVQRLLREDYDDAVSSTWLHLVDRIAHLRKSDAVASWLRTTAYHEALRIARTRARRAVAEVVLTAEVPEEQPDLTLGVMRAQVRRAMATTMDDLSPTGQRLLAALLDDPDQSYRELAERHGIGVGSIGPIRARVFQRARVRLGELGITAPLAQSWAA
jgi:RNA polymerase sigma factor (sigma-70 family)